MILPLVPFVRHEGWQPWARICPPDDGIAGVTVLQSISILIVDDDLDLLTVLSAALSSPAWQALPSSSAAGALQALAKQTLSPLLIDALPGYQTVVTNKSGLCNRGISGPPLYPFSTAPGSA
jgi:hypothetical protein